MQGLLLVLNGLSRTVDIVLLVLELNYWLVSSLISFLFWTIHFIFSLPGTISLTLLQCWDCVCLGLAVAGESSWVLIVDAVQTVGNVLRGALAGLDALQLAWNLLCHVVIRSKEMMQRGLLNIALSGQNLHRQVWEALTITTSLATYLVNTLLNLILIAVQYVFSALLSFWFCMVNLLFISKEWILTMISQLSNTGATMVILLWAPFQMAADVLVYCSTGVGAIVSKHLYKVLLLLFLIWVSRMVLRPSPAIRFLQEKLSMFYQSLLMCLHIVLSSDVWRRVAERSLQLLRMYGAAWYRSMNAMRTRAQDVPQRVDRVQNRPEPARPADLPPARLIFHVQPNSQRNSAGDRAQTSQRAPPAPQGNAPQGNASTSRKKEAAKEDPWKLLKQQEESRKCVICQDENKSILLLPCRHLCLCAQCSHILLQQPILQRNCPLCRHYILQALNVYM